MRLAASLGLPDADRESLFYAALLKNAGCSSNAAALTSMFGGDERALKAMQVTAGRSVLATCHGGHAIVSRRPLRRRRRGNNPFSRDLMNLSALADRCPCCGEHCVIDAADDEDHHGRRDDGDPIQLRHWIPSSESAL